MNTVYLLLGSNMGDSLEQLETARKHISKKIGIIWRQSRLYQTAAWGKTDQPDFVNQVVIARTTYDAEKLIHVVLRIEEMMGRIRTEKNAPRLIDIDILYFNKAIITTDKLVVPHPAISERRFVLVPLNELSPRFKHPVLNKTNHQILLECTDALNVKKI